ncbi:MAG: hypothetical protein KF716_20570 [Anaerolineae bacterium]|nr:hypothetical protein [Anaerolineae bacterium]
MRTIMRYGGILIALVGGIFFLQGIGVLPGSFMTNDPFWAVVGAIMVVVAVVLIYFGVRNKPANPST